jgi:glucan biosynthesis protein C
MTDQTPERLHALDAVRGTALMLGIVFHATMSFLPTPPGVPVWIVMDSHRSVTLAVVFHVLHIFRMTTFFLIAGFFAHMTFHKKGQRAFIFDRLKRIGLPLLIGWPIIFAMIVAATIWGAVVMAHGGKLPPAPPYAGFPAFPLTHLWFLYVLLLLYTGTLFVRGLVSLADRSGRLGAVTDAVVRLLVNSPFGFVALAAPTAAALWLTPQWAMWFGIPTPDSSLVPNVGAAVAFATAFGLGWLVHRQVGLMEIWKRRWPLNLALAVAFTAAGLSITGLAPLIKLAPHDWTTAAYAICYTMAVWTWTFAVIGLALRYLADHSPVRRYIADASYWLYLIHLPILMVLQIAISQLAWPWWVKFPLILAIAFPLMFASYQLMVRHSFIGAILNGRRAPRPSRSPAPTPAGAQELAR